MARPTDLIDLLAQDAWARRLARSLARGPEDSDDLVQEAYTRALAQQDAPIDHARKWFARVLRNVSVQRRRADSAREQRELAHARARAATGGGALARDEVDIPHDTEPSPDELAARAEVQERLAAAVLALEPRQRDVLLLRHFDGASLTAIARRLGLAPATVHEHLERGHAELRRKLASWDADTRLSGGFALLLLGGESSTIAALGPGGAAAVAIHSTPLLLFMTISKLSIGVGVVAALSFLLWRAADDTLERDVHTRGDSVALAGSADRTASVAAATPDTGTVAARVKQEVNDVAAAELDVADGDEPQTTTVHVLDWNRAPVAAVTVTAGLYGGGAESARATTNAEGRASIVLDPSHLWMVSATTASGHGSRLDVQSGQEVTLTLEPAMSRTASVIDQWRQPVAGALVLFVSDGRRYVGSGRTNEAGRTGPLTIVDVGKIGVEIEGNDVARTTIDVSARMSESMIEVRVVRGLATLSGTVLGPDGPLANAKVVDQLRPRRRCTTDEQGRFVVGAYEDDTTALLIAEHPHAVVCVEQVQVTHDMAPVILEMRYGRELSVHVHDSAGRPIAGARATSSVPLGHSATPLEAMTSITAVQRAASDDAGVALLRGLLSNVRVEVEHPDFNRCAGIAAPGAERLDIVLQPRTDVAVQLELSDAVEERVGLEGWSVTVYEKPVDVNFNVEYRPLWRCVTDRHGQGQIRGLRFGEYVLSWTSPGDEYEERFVGQLTPQYTWRGPESVTRFGSGSVSPGTESWLTGPGYRSRVRADEGGPWCLGRTGDELLLAEQMAPPTAGERGDR